MTVTRAARSDAVRDQRIERLVPLLTPLELFDELPLVRLPHRGPARRPRRRGGDPRRRRRPAARRRRPLQRPRSRSPVANTPSGSEPRHVRLSGELLIAMRVYFEKPRTIDRLEGADQRSAPRRLRRRQCRSEDRAAAAARRPRARDPRSAASSSIRSPRSTSPTSSPGARSVLARRRARSTASSAPACQCRSASRTGTDGSLQVAVDAVRAAGVKHAFAGIDADGRSAILHTRGNGDCHIILRGGTGAPNYGPEHVAKATELLRCFGPARAGR